MISRERARKTFGHNKSDGQQKPRTDRPKQRDAPYRKRRGEKPDGRHADIDTRERDVRGEVDILIRMGRGGGGQRGQGEGTRGE